MAQRNIILSIRRVSFSTASFHMYIMQNADSYKYSAALNNYDLTARINRPSGKNLCNFLFVLSQK